MAFGHSREPQIVSAVDDSRTSTAAAPNWGSRPPVAQRDPKYPVAESVPAGVPTYLNCVHDIVHVISERNLVGECHDCKQLLRLGVTYPSPGKPFYFTEGLLRQEWSR